MNISLVRLAADGRSLKHQYQPEELDLSDYEWTLAEAPLVTCYVSRSGQNFRVRGQVVGRLIVPCDRCLRDVHYTIDHHFDLFYTPSELNEPASGETELHERDLDFSVCNRDEIDLDTLVVEQLALNLPTRLLCREDCRGLCDQCGTDLNLEICRCEKPIDSRWQPLADWRTKS